MKTTIAIFTTTRAEFGAFIPLIRVIERSERLNHLLFVGGAHLAHEYGHTIDEINKEGFPITGTFDYLLNENTSSSITKSCGLNLIEIASIFNEYDFDIVCLAGDRYELLSIAFSSILFKKPIIHLYGGEITEGVIDDQVRHMLTKSAHLHFTSCGEYAEHVKKMGEENWRVHVAGELVIDNVKHVPKAEKHQLFSDIGISPERKTVLLTYHPVTLEKDLNPAAQFDCIIQTLKKYEYQVVITTPNAEIGSDGILEYINKQINENSNFTFVHSLGLMRYYSLLPFCAFMIGNSSSGLLEAPFFKVPTINIGNRQAGRLLHESVLSCECSDKDISDAIKKTEEKSFQEKVAQMKFKLGDGYAAERIVSVLENMDISSTLLFKKLDFENGK